MSDDGDSVREMGAQEVATRIYEIGLLASQSGDLDRVIRTICLRLIDVTGADYVGIGIVEEAGEWLVHRAGAFGDGSDVRGGYRHRLGEGVTGKVAQDGKPICLRDVRSDPHYIDLIGQTRSELAFPLIVGGRTIAVLNLESDRVGAFGEATMTLVGALVSPISLAIHNAWLVEEQHLRTSQLEKLARVSEVITSTVDLSQLVGRTIDSIREQFGYEFVGLGLVDDSGTNVRLAAMSADAPVQVAVGHTQPVGMGVTGYVVKTGKSLLLSSVSAFPGRVSTGLGLGSEMCCPLRVQGRTFGFLDAESRTKGAFADPDLLILETVADHIAPAIQNARNLERNNELREELTGMLIHDLRNPLTVIGSSMDLLERQLLTLGARGEDPAIMDSALRNIHHARGACDQMLVMIDGMLELHRIESGAMHLVRKPTDCRDLIDSVIRCLSTVAEAEHVTLTARACRDSVRALLDPAIITRVMENLVVNSIKFTPKGGEIVLGVQEADEMLVARRLPGAGRSVLITVKDSGEGIPAQDQDRIFDRFAVLESRRMGKKYSTGLGLAFCRQAVMAHGGNVWVESEPDQGSTFFVLLPA